MQRYKKYKDSGVDWIGEIPQEWKIRKLKFLGNIYAGINGKKGYDFSKEYSKGIKSFIPFTNICNNIRIDETKYQFVKIDEKENQNRVQKNDILFLMSSETLDDIAKNSIYLGDDNELYLNSFCKGFRISNSDTFPEYINYLFLSSSYRNYFSLVGRGFTRINLKQEFINDVYTLLPSLSEQKAIATFLDDKTSKIDQTIANKQKEIELLKERRQILIQKAVTKGLDATAILKDSGVDWIGEIPKHWEVRKLKYIFKIVKRIAGKEGFNILSITQKGIKVKNITSGEGQIAADYSNYQFCDEGDFAMNHMDLLTGWVDISKYNGVISPDYRVFQSILSQTDNKYLLQLLQLCYVNKSFYANGQGVSMLGRWRFPTENFNNFSFPIPSKAEQTAIVSYLEEIEEKISKAITFKKQEIEKLKEYKTVLVDNVVTGKVRVS